MNPQAIEVVDRVCISGGGLEPNKYWMPRTIETLGADRYVTLHGNDYMLCKFLGFMNSRDNGQQAYSANATKFLDHLRHLRTTAVERVALAFVREKVDAYCQKIDAKTRKRVREGDIPEYVNVYIDGDAYHITMRTRLTKARSADLQLTSQNISNLQTYATLYIAEGMGQRMAKTIAVKLRVATGFNCVRVDYAHQHVYATWSDQRGLQYGKRLREPCDTSDPRSVRCAVARTINFLRENHHVAFNTEMVLASVNRLGVFAENGEMAKYADEAADEDGGVPESDAAASEDEDEH